MEIIRDMFTERDQNCILNMQVEEGLDRDVVYWSKENTCVYSVKSAYNLLQVMKGYVVPGDDESIWRKLWKIKAPPKALNMVWRALSNNLPTIVQLRGKQVQVNQICPICQEYDETILHSIISCKFASSCRTIVFAGYRMGEHNSFANWFNTVLSSGSQTTKEEIGSVCWLIWRARNKFVWNRKATSVNRVVQLKAAQVMSTSALLQPGYVGDGAVIWVKPQRDTIKVTVDAAVFEDREEVAIGLVARDYTGDLVHAHTRVFKVRSRVQMRSPSGQVIESCRRILRRRNNIVLHFINRSTNNVAHQLARVAYLYPDRNFDRESIPIEVMNCIVGDCYN
ncbi:uncharacterized protein LOC141659683 [Apium graveolens]|uniref:uncharacterized protein LOC141659683 n=1 Tax=Apium graveolens TaxID=4045 RepID=UPI003D7A14A2